MPWEFTNAAPFLQQERRPDLQWPEADFCGFGFGFFLHLADAPFLKTSMLPMCSKVWDLTVRRLCGFHRADNYCQAHADIPGK